MSSDMWRLARRRSCNMSTAAGTMPLLEWSLLLSLPIVVVIPGRIAAQGALCRDVYSEFLHELVIASRRHKDELLTAMLELLLSASRALLRPAVSTVLCQAARRSYLR